VILRLDIVILSRRRPVLGNPDSRRPQPQNGQSVRVRIGQRLEQKRAGDAENCSVGSDTNGQREHDHGRESRCVCKRAHRIAKIVRKILNKPGATRVPVPIQCALRHVQPFFTHGSVSFCLYSEEGIRTLCRRARIRFCGPRSAQPARDSSSQTVAGALRDRHHDRLWNNS
jgi:hypothetical protein